MKFHTLISLVLGGVLLPFAATAQDYYGLGYSEADYGVDSTLLRYSSGVGFKNPVFKGQYYTFGKYIGAELGNIGFDSGLSALSGGPTASLTRHCQSGNLPADPTPFRAYSASDLSSN